MKRHWKSMKRATAMTMAVIMLINLQGEAAAFSTLNGDTNRVGLLEERIDSDLEHKKATPSDADNHINTEKASPSEAALNRNKKGASLEMLVDWELSDEIMLSTGETAVFEITGISDEEVTWSSTKPKVASFSNACKMDESIEVTAWERGNTVIKAKAGSKTLECKVTVLDENVESTLCYFVNAGDINPKTLNDEDKYGIYNSSTEQFYGEDPVTGMKWGLLDEKKTESNYPDLMTGKWTWPCENNGYTDATSSAKTYRYTRNQPEGGIGIPYKFELSEGEYSVTVNMATGWSGQWNHEYVITVNKGKSTEQKKQVKTSLDSENPATAGFTAQVGADKELILNVDRASGSSCAVVNQIYIRKIEPQGSMIEEVKISPDTVTVSRGGKCSFAAVVSGSGDFDDSVIWSVEGNHSSQTVIENGKLEIAEDETAETLTVTAKAAANETKQATSSVKVTKYSFQTEEVFINLDEDEDTAILSLNGDLDGKSVSWSSSNPEIAEIAGDAEGGSVLVKGKARGLAVFTAEVDGETKKCIVAVINDEVDPSLYYFVNAGDINPTTRNNDYFGICNSVMEQFYDEDPETGMKWGVGDVKVESDQYPQLLTGEWTWPCENNGYDDYTDSAITYRYAKDQPSAQEGGIGIPYRFELPAGQYSVTLNMATGWVGQKGQKYDITVNEGKDTEQKKTVTTSTNAAAPATAEFITAVGEDGELLLNIDKAAGSGCAVVNQIYIRKYDLFPRFEQARTSMTLGSSYQLKAVNVGGTELNDWKSSAPDIISVDNQGTITAKGLGHAVITAMAGSVLLTAKINVTIDSEIVIDYTETVGPINHVAGGNLHLFDYRSPAGWLSDGVSVHAVRGQDHSLVGGYNNYEYLPGFFEEGTYNRLQDMNPDTMLMIGVYYGYKGLAGDNWKKAADDPAWSEKFRQHIAKVMAEAEEKGIEVYSWIPMNEPDLQWTNEDKEKNRPEKFYEVAYKEIKRINPDAKVQGPEVSGSWEMNYMKNFLLYCKEHDCLPDVFSWHDLRSTRPSIEEDLNHLNGWMKENGIEPMPFTVTEYQGIGYATDQAGRKDQGNYNTGLTTAYLASLERAEELGLVAGLRSEWGLSGNNPNSRGDMGEMCDFDTKQMATGLWYMYNAYWNMTGEKLKTEHNKQKIEVLATVDTSETKLQSTILIGNWKESKAIPAVVLKNIPDSLIQNGKIHVRMEGINETLATPCYGTSKLGDQDVEVNEDGSLTLYPELNGRQSCYLVITPPAEAGTVMKAANMEAQTTGNIVREEKDLNGESYVSFIGGKTSSYKDEEGNETYVETGDSVSFQMTAHEDGIYNMSSTFVTGSDAGFMALYVDGKQFGFPVDLYGNEKEKQNFNHGNLYLCAGVHEFTFRIVGHGKNQESSGMTLNFMGFGLNELGDGRDPILEPEVTEIKITPKNVALKKGETMQFTANIAGTGAFDDSVDWSVSGAGSENTQISNTGLLVVALDENAEGLRVVVKSTFNPSIQAEATVTVTVEEETPEPVKQYILTVENGSGSGRYEANTEIEIKADVPKAGMKFDGWKLVSGIGKIENAAKMETIFTMAAQNAKVQAVYVKKEISQGNGSDSSSSDSSSFTPVKSGQREKPTVDGRWNTVGNDWKFLKDDGTYATSWQRVLYNGKLEWYYFAEEGIMQVGWMKDKDGEDYYLWMESDGTRGTMVTGWKNIGGKWYYFNPVSNGKCGALLRNTITPDGYRVDENGIWIK